MAGVVAEGGGRARVWVAVEVGGAEDLGEEGVGGALGEEVAVEPLCLDPGDVGELEGRHELHGEHARCGGRPEDLGHLLRGSGLGSGLGLGLQSGGRCPLTPPLVLLLLNTTTYYYSLLALT